MSIYYQWIAWAYSHIASKIAKKDFLQENTKKESDIIGLPNFSDVRASIEDWDLWILPIENSYAGSIHINLYNFLKYDFIIIWEIYLPINHQLLAKTNDISKIKFAYSHPQALSQCQNFLKKNNIQPIEYIDTSKAAEFVSENKEENISSISSNLAWELYNLETIKSGIQDQDGNTTRFFVITRKKSQNLFLEKEKEKKKISIIFQSKHIPSALYKCLWAFATNNINLTKIESLPSYKDKFHYYFRLDFEWNLEDEKVKWALNELKYFTNDIKILGEY